jgi:crossover junction endodeoxyribonuclease RusA
MKEVVLVMPWFDKVLNPNNKVHWAVKAKAAKKQKKDAWLVALAEKKPPLQDLYFLDVMFYPPDNRIRDLDNCMAACKGMFDGIAQAWGVNDSKFRFPNPDFGVVVKYGQIVVRNL